MKNIRSIAILAIIMFCGVITAESQLKKRVAVSRFEDRSGGGYNHLGEGISDMLATALVKSGKFIVVERQDLEKVLQEQKLGESGLVTEQSAPKVGKLLGVDLLVIGSISEFGTSQREIGANVPLFGGSITQKNARAAIDIRLINTTTGEIIAAEKEEGSESTTGLSGQYDKIDFRNVSDWNNTDAGKAAREAVDECVELIADNFEKIPWSGRILKVNPDGTVLMKPGSQGNVKEGMEFDVYQEGEVIIDPDTGSLMGREETKVGSIKVTEDMLSGKASKAKVLDGSGMKAGDVVREKK